MGPPSYMRSVVDRKVVKWCTTVIGFQPLRSPMHIGPQMGPLSPTIRYQDKEVLYLC